MNKEIKKVDSSRRITRQRESLKLRMTMENCRSEILCAFVRGNGYSSAPDMTGGSEETVHFLEGELQISEMKLDDFYDLEYSDY